MGEAKPINQSLNRWLWVGQWTLALLFGAYVIKAVAPIVWLAHWMKWPDDVPAWLVRFTGFIEALGAIGIVGPAWFRIWPQITVLAAAGFVVVQILAIGFHLWRGEILIATTGNLFLLGLSLFVLIGRWKLCPIACKGC